MVKEKTGRGRKMGEIQFGVCKTAVFNLDSESVKEKKFNTYSLIPCTCHKTWLHAPSHCWLAVETSIATQRKLVQPRAFLCEDPLCRVLILYYIQWLGGYHRNLFTSQPFIWFHMKDEYYDHPPKTGSHIDSHTSVLSWGRWGTHILWLYYSVVSIYKCTRSIKCAITCN